MEMDCPRSFVSNVCIKSTPHTHSNSSASNPTKTSVNIWENHSTKNTAKKKNRKTPIYIVQIFCWTASAWTTPPTTATMILDKI